MSIKVLRFGFLSFITGMILLSIPVEACFRSKKEVHICNYAKPGQDITKTLQYLIDHYSTIVIDSGTWFISSGIKLRSNTTIKGADKITSILKRNDFGAVVRSGVLFCTEESNVYIFTQHNPKDNFEDSKLRYSNIHFENITIDFNRSPVKYSKESLSKANLYGIIFSRCKDCTVKNCRFIDSMNEYANNGCPAISFVQSRDCCVYDCFSEHVTFLKSVYSNSMTVSGNYCEYSVGTCIESVGGNGGVFENNCVKEVYWNVSCVGINTTNCLVRNNYICSSANNTSCLTLGHRGYESFSASGSRVYDNTFLSKGVRTILIQNGSNLRIKGNVLTCVLTNDSPTPTFGCVVARGEDNYDICIEGNEMTVDGDKLYGAISYSGPGGLFIYRNKIKSNRGIVVDASTDVITIEGNEVYSSKYSICVNSPNGSIIIKDNHLTDGLLIKGGARLNIQNNHFSNTPNSSYFYGNWGIINISNNTFKDCIDLEQLFLINAEHEKPDVDASNVTVSNNTIINCPNTIVRFSRNNNVRQLHNIVLND